MYLFILNPRKLIYAKYFAETTVKQFQPSNRLCNYMLILNQNHVNTVVGKFYLIRALWYLIKAVFLEGITS